MARAKILPIQGLRVFAIGIVFFHLHSAFGTWDVFPYGLELAVTFFFVLSGYLSMGSDISDVKGYYNRKFLKIWPIHLTTFILMSIAYIPTKSFWTTDTIWIAILNIFLLQAYYPSVDVCLSFNQPSWFLSALMLFYILFPFFLHLRTHSKVIFTIIVFASIVLAFAIRCFTYGKGYSIELCGRVFFFPLTRLSDCLLGMLMYDFKDVKNDKNKNVAEFIVLMATLLLVLTAKKYLQPPFCYYIFLLATMMIIYIYVSPIQGFVSRLLSNRVIVSIGGLSMEIYMFHMVAMRFVPSIEFFAGKFVPFVEGCLVFIMTFVMVFMYRWLMCSKIKFITISPK